MILVKSVSYIEVNKPYAEMISMHPDHMIPLFEDGVKSFKNAAHIISHIKGRVLRRADGSEIMFGFSPQAEEIFGVTMKTLDEHEETIRTIRLACSSLRDEAEKLKIANHRLLDAGFFTRLKWLFTRVDYL